MPENIDDGIGIVLSVWARGKARSKMILSIIGWLNLFKSFWRKVHFLGAELLATWLLGSFTGIIDGLDVKDVSSLVTNGIEE